MTLCSTRFAFVISLKLSRRLLCSVRFVFVSTFNRQRGRTFVVGITNLKKFGCLCKGKSSGRPPVSEEYVRRIQEMFESSLGKSTRTASTELGIPQPNVWRVLRRRSLLNRVQFFNHTLFVCVCVCMCVCNFFSYTYIIL